jgi:tRNA(Arg) A34 adenosine deaminase TadA
MSKEIKGAWAAKPKISAVTPPAPKTLADAFKALAGTEYNVAGYLEGNSGSTVLRYIRTKNVNTPAVAIVLDSVPETARPVYTNLSPDHWILTYTGKDVVCVTPAHSQLVNSATAIDSPKLALVGGDRASTQPITGGGLYGAAERLCSGKKGTTKSEHALEAVVRYYMLAAYSLLGICADAGYSDGNYIAAIMVDDKGSILSFGVNSGWFHHGEVNMLLNYFSKSGNGLKTTYPENTIVFSTLTPCRQCTKYLLATKPAKSIIYIGQEDTGDFGKEGADHFSFLDQVTKPPRMVSPVTGSALHKVEIHSHLSSKMVKGKGTTASQIGKNCKQALLGSANTLVKKTLKDRSGKDPEEQAIKDGVLSYLTYWLGTVDLTKRKI